MTCQWTKLTGIDCDKDATTRLIYDDHQMIEVCEEHSKEYLADMKKRLGLH